MKKLFISISAAFVFILSCIIPFTASAVYGNRETDVNSFLSHYKSDYLNDASGYIFFNFDIQNPNVTTACVIKFTEQQLQSASINYASNILDISNGVFNGFFINDYVNSYSTVNSFRSLHFDFNTDTGYLIDYYNYRCNFNLNSDAENFHFYNFDTNLDVMKEPIEVELFPELTMDFDYTAEFMGETYPMQLLQVDIKNNTLNNYQYAIVIQPEGAGFDTEAHGNTNNKMIFWGDSDITYALMRDEWCYLPGDGRTTSISGWELYNTPSPWHFVGANSYTREQIYFDQMKLKKGQNYVFKVFAYNQAENTFNGFYGLDTNNKVFSTGGYPLTPVYTKTFSVTEDTEFDSNNYTNGNYSFNPDAPLDTQFDQVKAVYDTSKADYKITDGGTYDSIYDSKPRKTDKYAFNDTKSVNSTFDNLVTQSSSYFLLLLSVFNYFPVWFTALLFTGFLGIIIVFIIKKI